MKMGKYKDQKVYYAQAQKSRLIDFDEVVRDISEMSSLTTGDVRNAIDRIAYYLKRELTAGNVVQLGQIGTFSLTAYGRCLTDPTQIDAHSVRKPKIRVHINKYLRGAINEYSVSVHNPYRRKDESAGSGSTLPGGSGGTQGGSAGREGGSDPESSL